VERVKFVDLVLMAMPRTDFDTRSAGPKLRTVLWSATIHHRVRILTGRLSIGRRNESHRGPVASSSVSVALARRPRASRSARTRNDEASGAEPSRSASTEATSSAKLTPRARAISCSTSQNAGSSATLVRWPARRKLRLIRRLRFVLPAIRSTSPPANLFHRPLRSAAAAAATGCNSGSPKLPIAFDTSRQRATSDAFGG
jgi:hypothetical protein